MLPRCHWAELTRELVRGLTEKHAHEAGGRQFRDHEGRGGSKGTGEGFGGQVAAAGSAFHGGGPAGGGPVSGEEDFGPGAGAGGADAVETGADGVSGANFLDDGGLEQIDRGERGEEEGELAHGQVDDLLTLHGDK